MFSVLSLPVRTIIGRFGWVFLIWVSKLSPSMSGRLRSRRMRSGLYLSRYFRPLLPVAAV